MNNKLGSFLKNYRTNQNLSLRQFGLLCSISHTHIDSIEKGYDPRTGKKVNLTNHAINKLAIATGTKPSHLLNLSLNIDDSEDFTRHPIENTPRNSLINECLQFTKSMDENELKQFSVYLLAFKKK